MLIASLCVITVGSELILYLSNASKSATLHWEYGFESDVV